MPKYKSNVNDIWRDYHAKVSEYAGKGKPTKALLDSGVRMNADSIGEANMGQFFSLGLGCHTQRGPMGRRFRLDWHITIGRPSRTREYDCEIKGFFSFEAIAPMLPVIYANMDGYSLCDLLVMGPVPLMRVADPSTFCPVLSSNDYICAAAISEPDQHGCMLWEYTEFDDNMIGFTRHCSPEPRYPDSQIWEIWSDVLTNRKRLPGQLQLPYTG